MNDKKKYFDKTQGEDILGSISLSTELLEDISGFWAMEIDPELPPRLYLDEESRNLLGIVEDKSAEELFNIWESFLDSPTKNVEKVALANMQKGKRVESKYFIHTLDGRDLVLKVEGLVNKEYKKGVRIDGLYRNLTKVYCATDEIFSQRTKYIENFTKAYDFVYKVNLNDASFLILKIQEFMVKNYERDFKDFNELRDNMLNVFIHPSDRSLMAEELDYNHIRERIKAEPIYTVEYRAFINNNSYWNEMTVTRIDEDNVVLSFVANDKGIFLRMLQEKMSNNFFALYEVDFDANMIKIIQKEDFYHDLPDGRMVPYSLWVKALSKYYDGDMKELLLKLRDREYVYSTFENQNKLTFTYYSKFGDGIENKWLQCTIYAIKRHLDGKPSIFTIGFSFADPLEIENKELQKQVNKSVRLVKGLAEEYSALFYANLDDKYCEVYSYEVEKIGAPLEMFSHAHSALELLLLFGRGGRVHPDDIYMFEQLNEEYIRTRLVHTKKFTIRFRMRKHGVYTWCEFDFIKYEGLDDRANCVAIGFAERDNEIRSEQTISRCMDVISAKQKPSDAIHKLLEIIADFYGADRTFILEFNEDEKQVYNTFEWCKPDVESRNEVLKTVSTKEIGFWVKKFRQKGPIYKDLTEAKSHDFIADLRSMEGINNIAATPIYNGNQIVGCIGVDNLTRGVRDTSIVKNVSVLVFSEILRNKQEEESMQLINRFVHNYKASFIINSREDSYRPIISYQGTFSNFITGDSYIKGVLKYADQVYDDDKAMLKEALTYRYIYHRFKTETEFSIRYRCLVHGFTVWLEARFSKLNEDEFIFAIADVDERNGVEMVESAVSADFFALFLVDLKYDTLKVVKAQDIFRTNLLTKTMRFSTTLSLYASTVSEKYKSQWECITSVDGIKEFLMTADKRELIFEAERGNGRLARCTFYVISREVDGTPHMICLSFTELDDEQAEKELLNEKIAEQNMQLEKQQKALGIALKDAKAANESKTNFLFNMSHDIRTPMNAIRGFTIMAKKYVNEKERVLDYLNKIDVSGNQLLLLINQVLEMSRIESGKTDIINKPIDIKEKFESMVTVLGAQAKLKGLTFDYSFNNVKHLDVLADEARIGQITFNIVGNSLKYTPEGGRVGLRFDEIEPRKEGFATFVFTIEDNGIGMSEEFLGKLFEPFSREKNSTVSHIQGTGLGMTIVKSLIDIMGGTIEVSSKLGKGTKFVVTLDFEIDENAKKEKKQFDIKAISFEGKRVLLVEDNEMNREIATDILSDGGLVIETASDGDIAVNMIQGIISRGDYRYYDAILMDIQMPRMNGYDATRAIRKIMEPFNPTLPIIAMTANAFEEDKRNSKNAGMNAHLAKPIDVEKLFETLANYIS